MLVDHADAARYRVRRTGDLHQLAVQQDLTFVRLGQTVQHVHQGRLARAVLAEEGVDLAPPHVQIDVVVGDDAGIQLRHSPHL